MQISVLVRVQQRVAVSLQRVVVVAAIVADIVVIVVDIAVVAGNSNKVGAIVPYIVEDLVVDSIGMEGAPVAVDTGYIAVVGTADSRVDKVDRMVQVDSAEHAVEEVGTFYKAGGLQGKRDMRGKGGTEGMEDKERMVWAKAEETAFYMLAEDTSLGEWAMVQNYNYHNILHSTLAYIYRYYNIFHNNLYCMD